MAEISSSRCSPAIPTLFPFQVLRANKRKDRCRDKDLFNWKGQQYVYKIGRNGDSIGDGRNGINPLQSLINKLRYYQETHFGVEIHRACATLIEAMESESIKSDMAHPWSRDELITLQQTLSRKLMAILPMWRSCSKKSSSTQTQRNTAIF